MYKLSPTRKRKGFTWVPNLLTWLICVLALSEGIRTGRLYIHQKGYYTVKRVSWVWGDYFWRAMKNLHFCYYSQVHSDSKSSACIGLTSIYETYLHKLYGFKYSYLSTNYLYVMGILEDITVKMDIIEFKKKKSNLQKICWTFKNIIIIKHLQWNQILVLNNS